MVASGTRKSEKTGPVTPVVQNLLYTLKAWIMFLSVHLMVRFFLHNKN